MIPFFQSMALPKEATTVQKNDSLVYLFYLLLFG